MIAKHVQMKSLRKSSFAGVVKYIGDKQGKNERVDNLHATNCESDRPEVAVIEVVNTQARNRRTAKDKTYHLIVSFRAGEQPNDAVLKMIEARICDALGYGAHQRVSAVHRDTDNLHIHIAINKIHPSRYTIHHPYNDYKTLGAVCEKLEIEFGLQRDNHQARKQGAQNQAADMEHHAGMESLLGWIGRECQESIQGARSWTELHQVMHSNGLQMHERGNGLVITARDGTTVKASSVSRDCSKSRLEARFGAFTPSPERQASEHPAKQYEQKPLRLAGKSGVDTMALYARYKNDQQESGAMRTAEWAKARERKHRLIEAAKRSGRLKRAAIRLVSSAGPAKKLMYAMTSKTLKNEIEKIQHQYQKERQDIHAKCRRLAWADWLRAQAIEGDQQALKALRARQAHGGLKGDTLSGKGRPMPEQSAAIQDGVTKQGTIIYRVGASAVRDDGARLAISRGADQEGIAVALRMAMARYGSCIRIEGSSNFKDAVIKAAVAAKLPMTFEEAVLERRRQALLLQTAHPAAQVNKRQQIPQQAPQPTMKEQRHEPSDQSKPSGPASRGRAAGSGFVRSGATLARPTATGQKGRAVAVQRTGTGIGKRPPKAPTVCEACPNSVWFASPTVVTCYCRVMYLVTWSSREPQQITSCDGLFLGQNQEQDLDQDPYQ